MAVMVARVGRHRQRYEDNLRLVSGCIPYRFKKSDDIFEGGNLENKIEVLMIASPNRNDMVFPKGGWDNDETVKEAACREALEEAGVRGVLSETPLGVWEFRSKSSEAICSLQGGCRGYMFALEVTEELDAWPEQDNHHRKWLKVKDAFEMCRYEWMRRALEKFLNKLSDEVKLEVIGEMTEKTSSTITDVNVIADCQIIATNYCFKPPNAQHSVLLSFS